MIEQLKLVFLCLLLGLFASGCNLFEDDTKTEKEKLPKATQSGKNTFGCLMNGKAWVTETSIDADAYYQEGVLSIAAGLTNSAFNNSIGLSFFDEDLTEGIYAINEYPTGYGRINDKRLHCLYATNLTYKGSLVLSKLDQTNFIISGTFEFEAYSDDCDKIIEITDGRFDLTYAP